MSILSIKVNIGAGVPKSGRSPKDVRQINEKAQPMVKPSQSADVRTFPTEGARRLALSKMGARCVADKISVHEKGIPQKWGKR